MGPSKFPYKLFCYKDANHVVLKCSQDTLRCSGFKKEDQVIGTTDYQLPWNDYAEVYHKHELDILQGNIYSALIPLKDHNSNASVFLHNKFCEYDEAGNFLRLVCYATELINPRIYDLANLLGKSTNDSVKSYFIGKKINKMDFSPREQECLFFLLHGKSTNQIAKILNLSPRTVELYIGTIKTKLNCRNKSELYDVAMQLGFLSILPSEIMLKKLLDGLKHE